MEYLVNSVKSISKYLRDSIETSAETVRLARSGYSLYCAGICEGDLIERVVKFLLPLQFGDGGWTDPEETALSAWLIFQVKSNDSIKKAAVQWLKSCRHNVGGWGRHSRDRARIPITALVLTLLPETGSDEDYEWVAKEWANDLKSSVQLSYKAGFYLLVARHKSIQGNMALIDHTIGHLTSDQNDDGGFAPWKNHPIGSDPWSTGVVLWGLSKWIDKVDPTVIERALHWLEVTQLPSGFWPYHYLDEGTSYALIGAVSAMRAMASRR